MAATLAGGTMGSVRGAALLLIAVIAGCHGFTCFVCLPPVVGTDAEMNRAMEIRANITRTWPAITEKSMGECTSMEASDKFMLECPTDNELTTCSKISAASGAWSGHSCGVISKQVGIGCHGQGDVTYCMCASPLCNSPAGRSAPLGAAVAIMAVLVAARALTQTQ